MHSALTMPLHHEPRGHATQLRGSPATGMNSPVDGHAMTLAAHALAPARGAAFPVGHAVQLAERAAAENVLGGHCAHVGARVAF